MGKATGVRVFFGVQVVWGRGCVCVCVCVCMCVWTCVWQGTGPAQHVLELISISAECVDRTDVSGVVH